MMNKCDHEYETTWWGLQECMKCKVIDMKDLEYTKMLQSLRILKDVMEDRKIAISKQNGELFLWVGNTRFSVSRENDYGEIIDGAFIQRLMNKMEEDE